MKLEIKKLLFRPSLIIVSSFFIMVNILFFTKIGAQLISFNTKNKDSYMYFYNLVKGEITEEKVKKILDIQNKNKIYLTKNGPNSYEVDGKIFYPLEVNSAIELIKEDMKFTYFYPIKIKKLITNTKNNIDKRDLYNNRICEKIIKIYKNRYIFNFSSNRGYFLLLNYKVSSLFVLIILLLPLSSIFSEEKEKNTYQMIIGTYSKKIFIKQKFFTGLFITFIIGLIFYIIDFICFFNIWPVNFPLNPIYSIENYQNSPLTLSILYFLSINFLLMLAGYLFMAIIFMITSLKTGNSNKSLVFNYIILIVVGFLSDLIEIPGNPFLFLTNKKFFKEFNVVNVVGFPILKEYIYIIIAIIVLIALILLFKREAKKW